MKPELTNRKELVTMDEDQVMDQMAQMSGQAREMFGQLLEVTKPNAVFGSPIQQGPYAIITASELVLGVGGGYGGGGGPDASAGEEEDTAVNGGVGIGGGGLARARPVATISVGPDGVAVTPVIDTTKLGIAFLSSLAAILVTALRVRSVLRSATR
jgi:uncharacterized spore protein YtfJ